MGGGIPRQRPTEDGGNGRSSILVQLLPLILLFAFSFLNALPSLFSGPTYTDPRFSFSASARYDSPRTTRGLGIPYHVNGAELRAHPVIGAEIARAAAASPGDASQVYVGGKAMEAFERNVEKTYTRELYASCQRGLDLKERRKEREIGFMGIGTDWDKVKKIEAERIEECEELRRFGLIR
jgi:DnaJ homolog subfamily B member 12